MSHEERNKWPIHNKKELRTKACGWHCRLKTIRGSGPEPAALHHKATCVRFTSGQSAPDRHPCIASERPPSPGCVDPVLRWILTIARREPLLTFWRLKFSNTALRTNHRLAGTPLRTTAGGLRHGLHCEPPQLATRSSRLVGPEAAARATESRLECQESGHVRWNPGHSAPERRLTWPPEMSCQQLVRIQPTQRCSVTS